MRITIITAGGAGMYCGSCMHDNTWARALIAAGHDVTLLPTYTPIRVDEADASTRRVFLGGVNVYLDGRWRWWRRLPRWMKAWVDSRWFIRFATGFGVSNDARELGELTLSLLSGDHGPHQRAVEEMARFITEELQPEIIVFSNSLLAGILPRIRQETNVPIVCVLQGDDIFLDGLVEPHRVRVFDKLRELAPLFDGFLTHSLYYKQFMRGYLSLPESIPMYQLPLTIDPVGYDDSAPVSAERPFTVGYFARICPEKGLHQLVEAFQKVHAVDPQARLRVGGYLGKRDRAYFQSLQQQIRKQGLGKVFDFVESPDRVGKHQFLRGLDVFSVPTTYREPKGLSILEAMYHGVPVVQPAHGSFPELLGNGGGMLFPAGDLNQLANLLLWARDNADERRAMGERGKAVVRSLHLPQSLAKATGKLFREFVRRGEGEG